MPHFPSSSEQDDSAYSPSRIPASPTARRQASGKAHPPALDLSPSSVAAISSASALLALDSPPRTMESSLSPRMLAATPPITPTRRIPSSAGSDSGAARRAFARGGGAGEGDELDRRARAEGTTSLFDSNGTEARPTTSSLPQLHAESRSRLASFSPALPLSNGHGAPQRRPSILGYNVSRRGSSFQQQQAGGASPTAAAMSNTRFLLTVIPPSHLPHDPPHPKSNPNCSGYGPPEHFKRGTLIPLYPTLSSQLAAIAREYGLPSTGGLVLYLLSTSDPSSSVQASLPGAAGFEGGPRISEEAWNLLWRRLFEEEEEVLLLAESEDEDGYAPPVPPIPLSHRNYPSDGASPADPTFAPSFSDAQQQRQHQRAAGSRRIPSESDQALFSDGGEHEVERTSFSSEGDPDGSVYSGGGAVEHGVGEGSKSRASAGNRSSSRTGIGRGHPSGLPSPSASSRFASAPIPSTSRYSSYSQPNLRQVSRQSVRSNASRFGRSSYAASGRATSFSNYSSQGLGGEPYGAAVVVGKVEFDIDRRKGGKSKWYEGWIESAGEPTSSGGTSSAVPSPRTREGVAGEGSVGGASTVSTAERDVASTYDTEATSPRTTVGSRNFSGGSLAPVSRGLRPLELSRSASPSGSLVEKAEDPMSPESSVAASGYSNAAMAGHGDDEEADGRSPSARSLAPSSRQRSRSSSLASSTHQHSLHRNDDEGYAPLVDSDANYTQLEDDDTSNPFESGRESRQSQPESDESDYDEQVEQVERGQQEQQRREREDGSEEGDSRTATLHQADPLGDVFPDDESTWRSLAEEPTTIVEKDMIETTGLGIVGARVMDLKSSAPPGVVEQSPLDESNDEAGLPPPQDDISDVMSMLKSGQSEDKTDAINLASPIHLDSSPTAPSTTGVFESSDSFDESRPPFDNSRASLDAAASSSFDTQSFEPAGGPVDLAARRRSSQRPRFGSGASARALNLVSIDVRPPSTVHSSPEYAPQRKQRQGWTNIPAVVDKSMSASTSLASLDTYGQPDSQRDSTIGLMENLDDLERALADLSPTTSRKSPAITQEQPTPEPSPQNLLALAQPSQPADESSVESRDVTSQPEPIVGRAATPPFPTPTSPVLGARPTFRYGASSSSSTSPAIPAPTEAPARPPREDSLSVTANSHSQANSDNEKTPEMPSISTFADSTPLAGAFASPEQLPVPAAEVGAPGDPSRTPRTSSLSRGTPQLPHQVALPPSPMPPQSESAWQEATSPVPPSAPFNSSPRPSSPRQFISQRPPPPMPPVPTKEDEMTFPEPPPRSPKSPKSPGGGFKSLRTKQSWKKNKDKDIDVSKAAASPDPAADTESTKSPRTAFFAGKPFQKLGGMFVKKSGSESSPDPSTSPVTAEPPVSSLDQQANEASTDPISPPFDRLTSSPPLQTFAPPSADDSADIDPPAGFDVEFKPPSIDYSTVRTSSYSGDFPPTASPDLLTRPLPTPVVTSQSLRPAASTDSFRSALSSLPTRNDSSPANSTAPHSIGNVTPTEDTFPTSYGADPSSSSYTPLPPLPYKSTTDSSDAEYTVSSPRSEYGQPQTPVQGPLGYAASAPATPAAWQQKYLDPGSRFGKGLAGASGGRQAAKQQLSADIDQLLSQMNEIDFGGEEEVAQGQQQEQPETSEEVVRPKEEESTQEQEHVEEVEEERSQEQEDSFSARRAKMQSLDVGVSLGGLMMAGSPPHSPTIPPVPSVST
ncbi:hypothetical protein BCR35DRAFT_323366 [Leucosporidium creatinivorum]|uniref:Proteophosphoglycan ppg4 n=1 Tax=Leucosporidium creatinivorum TaxID=106004 RepID=A0A1Y2G2L6_9BASI|nr:hypothetical protein BCR35DRAFT_323366 [Leucosporidium creatinivorum]